MKSILVTGGAGFIGSCFVRTAVENSTTRIINLDALTYAGNPNSIPAENDQHVFIKGSITDRDLVSEILKQHRPNAIINFAAESHVDRSIDGPEAFIETNITGTYRLLDACKSFWSSLDSSAKNTFRFLHVSTDEVFGSLGESGYFTETTPYAPKSP